MQPIGSSLPQLDVGQPKGIPRSGAGVGVPFAKDHSSCARSSNRVDVLHSSRLLQDPATGPYIMGRTVDDGWQRGFEGLDAGRTSRRLPQETLRSVWVATGEQAVSNGPSTGIPAGQDSTLDGPAP